MAKFKGKYRIESIRAQWWNYGWNGAYFITICTKNRKHFFGEIQNGKMVFSSLGIIVNILWHEIPNHSKHVSLGAFVVMPNHIHGILLIDKPGGDGGDGGDGGGNGGNGGGNGDGNGGVVETRHALSLRGETGETGETTAKSIGKIRFQNQGKNTISSIVGSYKSAITRHANRLQIQNGWQAGFHDHIIRNHAEYNRIENYIIKNPQNWKEDKFHN
ncbi:transposase [Aequorivita flava]|uniref:Transposase n=1 Tax=Aequorivita flava TaxID=3114371 RepID=A0AB35YWX3_9FLAO